MPALLRAIGEAHIFPVQDDNLTAELPLVLNPYSSIYSSTKVQIGGRHNRQRDGGPEKGLYRLHPIALALFMPQYQKKPGGQKAEVRDDPDAEVSILAVCTASGKPCWS